MVTWKQVSGGFTTTLLKGFFTIDIYYDHACYNIKINSKKLFVTFSTANQAQDYSIKMLKRLMERTLEEINS